MLEPQKFKELIVDIVVGRFVDNPTSLADAFCVIWAIDALSVHVAHHLGEHEGKFKDRLQASGGWQFRLIREASNAAKHAIRRNPEKADVKTSADAGQSVNFDGWAWYFSNAKHCGDQICIEVSWKFDEIERGWYDRKGFRISGSGPLLRTVPILDLIEPSVKIIMGRVNNH